MCEDSNAWWKHLCRNCRSYTQLGSKLDNNWIRNLVKNFRAQSPKWIHPCYTSLRIGPKSMESQNGKNAPESFFWLRHMALSHKGTSLFRETHWCTCSLTLDLQMKQAFNKLLLIYIWSGLLIKDNPTVTKHAVNMFLPFMWNWILTIIWQT